MEEDPLYWFPIQPITSIPFIYRYLKLNLLKSLIYLLIKNFKKSESLESSKHKKHDRIWTKITTPQSNNHEKTNKKGGKKKEGNLPKPLPFFSFSRLLLSLLPTTIYMNEK